MRGRRMGGRKKPADQIEEKDKKGGATIIEYGLVLAIITIIFTAILRWVA